MSQITHLTSTQDSYGNTLMILKRPETLSVANNSDTMASVLMHRPSWMS